MKKLVIFVVICVVIIQSSVLGVEIDTEDEGDSDFCDGESCDSNGDNKYSQVVNQEEENSDIADEREEETHEPEDINVMITFYNAIRNKKLISTFTETVNSILKHSSSHLAIHIIGDAESQELAEKIISENPSQNSNYKMVKLDVDKLAGELEEVIAPMQKHFSFKPGAYYNHALFFLSIAMHRVMPHLSKVIMLDADLKFMDDIKKLHDRFRLFTPSNIIGIGRDLQPVYRHTFWKYRQENPGTHVGDPSPNGLTGFNSGVLMLDLDKMRESKLYNTLLSADQLEILTKEFHFKGHLGDQDFFTLLSMKYEWLFHVLPCQWNRQLCQWWKDHGYKDIFDQYFTCEGNIKIYHGNCGTPIPDVD